MDDKNREFIDQVLSLEKESIRLVIDVFSLYLARTNEHYKYNETYLPEYVEEFIFFKEELERKIISYQKLINEIKTIKGAVELLFDESFHVIMEDGYIKKTEYVNINKCKIQSKQIDVRATFKVENMEYVYHSKFDSASGIEQIVKEDINKMLLQERSNK